MEKPKLSPLAIILIATIVVIALCTVSVWAYDDLRSVAYELTAGRDNYIIFSVYYEWHSGDDSRVFQLLVLRPSPLCVGARQWYDNWLNSSYPMPSLEELAIVEPWYVEQLADCNQNDPLTLGTFFAIRDGYSAECYYTLGSSACY